MNELKIIDVEQCLSSFNEFYESVTTGESDSDLFQKKHNAGIALNHLGMLLLESDGPDEDTDSNINTCTMVAVTACS